MFIAQLTLRQLQALASLRNATAQAKHDRDMTAILTAVDVDITADGEVTAIATDRYMVGEVTFTAHEHTGPVLHAQILDTALVDAAKIMKQQKQGLANLIDTDGTLSLVFGGLTVPLPTVPGNYPPVGRLLPDGEGYDLPANVRLDLGRVARVGKITGDVDYGGEVAFDITSGVEPKPGIANDVTVNKRGPVLFRREGVRALVQPNMIVRR